MPISITITATSVAWYAAIISTLVLALQAINFWRDRVIVVLDIKPDIRVYGSGMHKEDTDYVSITVRNKGKRTVTIQSVGYITKGKKELNGLLTDSLDSRELLDGKSTMYLVEQSLIIGENIKCFVAYDQAGREFKGKLFRSSKKSTQ